ERCCEGARGAAKCQCRHRSEKSAARAPRRAAGRSTTCKISWREVEIENRDHGGIIEWRESDLEAFWAERPTVADGVVVSKRRVAACRYLVGQAGNSFHDGHYQNRMLEQHAGQGG